MSTRPAVPEDHALFLRLMAELRLPPGEPLPERDTWVEQWMADTFFVERGGEVAGYAVVRILQGSAYVFHVVTDPAHRGRGVGREIMDACAARARAAGCTRWALNVKIDNAVAIRLYERCGMAIAFRSAGMKISWASVDRLPGEAGFAGRLAGPEEDAPLEAAFRVPRGRLSEARERLGRRVIRLVDKAHPAEARVGLASFDPTFPGAFPFAVARPSLARPLLDAIREHALPAFDHVRLVAEGDQELVAALVAVGGEVLLELFHMEGDVPAA
jgi:ribosomal protein S18 acetylase RimI-like enzyme